MEPPARSYARATGVVYLFYFVTAFAAIFLMKGIVVRDNAAVTANNILAHEALYRSGLAVGLIANAAYIALTALLYRLFEPVSRTISIVAAFFSLAGCTILIFAGLLQVAPLVMLTNSPMSSAFRPEQLQGTALLSLKLYDEAFKVSLVLFAFFDLFLGYLIYASKFLPRTLGVLLIVAGVGWMTFVWPPLGAAASPVVMPFGALAEIVLMLWLLTKGVSVSRLEPGT